jgi:hypothetical protein
LFLFGILKQDIIFPSLLAYSAITISTIIFAITLLTIAKRMIAIHNVAIGNYMNISAYGIIIFFASIAHSVIHTPYPPFTAACWAFAGLGIFLYTMGIYFTAVSISQDINLRRTIKKMATNQTKLLDSIGMAQMEEEMFKTILKVAKKQGQKLNEETGINQEITQERLYHYTNEILKSMKEVEAKKKENNQRAKE